VDIDAIEQIIENMGILAMEYKYIKQRWLRRLRPYLGLRANWSFLMEDPRWTEALHNAKSGPHVLIATSTGSNWPCSSFESMLGVALTLRGARVSFLLCDGALPACQECDHQWLEPLKLIQNGPQGDLCRSCFAPAKAMLESTGLPLLRYSQFINSNADPSDSSMNPELLEHANAGALRYFGRGTLPADDAGTSVLQRYINAAQTTADVIDTLIQRESPDIAVSHHGIYVPQGAVGHVLRKAGIRIVNWGLSYRKSTVLFSHGNSYHHTMADELPEQWADQNWFSGEEEKIMEYLCSRRSGGNDWISFQPSAEADIGKFISDMGLDRSRPIIGLLTNVIWDAQLHFRQAAFPSMLEWLFATIEHFIKRPDLQLVIRIHPAEVHGSVPSRQLAADEISQRFGKLPDHIKVIGPEVNISTYSLMALSNSALVYGTKTALELACNGLPVVVAGDAWCRGKGFTIDASSHEEYRQALEALPFPRGLTEGQISAARRYAYHFFFRRMIPLRNLKPLKHFGPYKVCVDQLDELGPGVDPGLDLICDGILTGRNFVFQP
jgi:hypothetical protein